MLPIDRNAMQHRSRQGVPQDEHDPQRALQRPNEDEKPADSSRDVFARSGSAIAREKMEPDRIAMCTRNTSLKRAPKT